MEKYITLQVPVVYSGKLCHWDGCHWYDQMLNFCQLFSIGLVASHRSDNNWLIVKRCKKCLESTKE